MSLFILILKVIVECVPLSYNKFLKIMILHVQNVTRLLKERVLTKMQTLKTKGQHYKRIDAELKVQRSALQAISLQILEFEGHHYSTR